MTAEARARVITLGCRLNAYESEIMRGHLDAADRDDLIVINTCTVTAEAERQARQTIRREKRRHPAKRIVVTGCAAQIDPAAYAAMPEVDHVIGNAEKLEASTFLGLDTADPVRVADIMTVEETAPHLIRGFDGRVRAFVQIQQGCDHRCTFCIIPFARGPNRSVGLGALVEQVRALVAEGFREIVLTGVDICSYGADLAGRPRLGDAVRRLLHAAPELPRLRLSSLDPAAMDDTLFQLLADEPRLMPHLHLSLQAMDDMVLKRMKRRHSVADAAAVVARARRARPDVAIGADLIAGFPTETEAMHRNTLAAVNDLEIPLLHVFPYSERGDTPAARMPSIPVSNRKIRAVELRAAGASALERFLAGQIGREANVLVEKPGQGLTEHYVNARIIGAVPIGAIARCRVSAVENGALIVRPV